MRASASQIFLGRRLLVISASSSRERWRVMA